MALKEFYRVSRREKKKLIEKIKNQLFEKKEIVFAYFYGSFLEDPTFRDIDIGIYLDTKMVEKNQFLDYQLNISKELEIPSKYLIDIRVLNNASNSFLSSIFKRGKLIFSKDINLLTDLIENVSLEVASSEGISRQSFLELIS